MNYHEPCIYTGKEYFGPVFSPWKFSRRLHLVQLTGTKLTQRKKTHDDEELPVVGNTPVINNYVEWVLNLLLKDWFYLECILSALRGVHLMAALWKVFSRGRWPHRLFLRKPRRNILRDVFQGAFLPKCYWDTGLRPVLTHGSIKWSFCVNIQTAMGYFKPGFFFSNLMICKFCND